MTFSAQPGGKVNTDVEGEGALQLSAELISQSGNQNKLMMLARQEDIIVILRFMLCLGLH